MFDQNIFKQAIAAISTSVSILAMINLPALATQNTFTVTNNTSVAINDLRISENGEDWVDFDLGGISIHPTSTLDFLWDERANSYECFWWIQATYSNGKESSPTQRNFCQHPDLIFSE